MSDSYRKPIIKDKPRNYKRTSAYWRPIRRIHNQIVKGYKNRYIDSTGEMYWFADVETWRQDTISEEIFVSSNRELLGTDIPDPKIIYNQYNYCDRIDDYRFCQQQSKKWRRRDKEELLKEKIKHSRK